MRVSELHTFNEWLSSSPVSSDRLWSRDLEKVSDAEISLFYARSGIAGLKAHAIEAIDKLQTAIILFGIDGGKLSDQVMRLVFIEQPLDRFCADEFIDHLTKLSPQRRSAVLFALETHNTPESVAGLVWKESTQLAQGSSQVREILSQQGRLRHIRLPYVFWEWASERIAAPLLQLQTSAEDAFGMPWPHIQRRYSSMLWISSKADAASFNSLVEEVVAGKL